MSKNLILLCAGMLFAVPHLHAQNIQPADTLSLETVVVTASKTPTNSRETTRPVVVITEAQIQQSAGKDIAQLLNEQNGISINGALSNPSKDKGVYIQGASTQYTLILIDGQPVTDPSGAGGAFDLRLFPLSSVERIEVVKGSMSTLYGSDAIAGVINIITKKPKDNSFNVNGLASYGSFNSFSGNLGINGKLDRFGYAVNYNRDQSDGISEAKDLQNTGTFDKDGYTRDAVNARLDVEIADGLTISPTVNYSSYNGDFDADAFVDGGNKYEAELVNPGGFIKYENGSLTLNGNYNYNKVKRVFIDEFGGSTYRGSVQNADVLGHYKVSEFVKVLAGFNFQQFIMDDNDPSTDNPTASLISPYASLQLSAGNGLGAELGFRFNQHSDAGSNANYSLSPYYNISQNIRVLGSLSTGFKAPTLNEMFGPFGANPDLKPQKSRYADIGVELFALDGRLNAKALYFNRHIDDVIIYDFVSGYTNQDKQDDQGFELSTGWIASEFLTVNGFYNYVTGKVTTDDGMGNTIKLDNLIRRPKHNAGLAFNINPLPQLAVNLTGSITGKRQDYFFDPNNFYAQEEVTLDAYTMINLYAEYNFTSAGIILFGETTNLLNADYYEVYGFNSLGRAAKLGLRFKF